MNAVNFCFCKKCGYCGECGENIPQSGPQSGYVYRYTNFAHLNL